MKNYVQLKDRIFVVIQLGAVFKFTDFTLLLKGIDFVVIREESNI